MERRNFLGQFGMGAAAVGAFAAVPGAVSAQNVAADKNSFKTADFGALGNGVADDTAAIQRAIDAAHNLGGGTVYLEGTKGRDFKCTGQLSLDNKRGVRVVGSAGPNLPDARQPNAQLNYTGTASPFISLKSTHSVTFEFLKISYSNPGFKGSLVETGHSLEAGADPGYLLFDRCRFAGNGKANSAENLLNLSYCLCSTVRNCEFQGSNVGIVGAASRGVYSNAIQVTDCVFRDLNVVGIKNAVESWLISGCTFEPLANRTGGAYFQGPGSGAWGLVIMGCWMGDATRPGGCWIDVTGGPALGLTIIGNRIAAAGTGPNDTAIKIGSGNQGVTIAGNRIEGAIGIDFTAGYTFGASITGNDLQCKTPIANLQNAMCHVVLGHYTIPNKLSGNSTFDRATFTGDGVHGGINLPPQTLGPPMKPDDGDVWTDNAGMYVRIKGQTRKVALV